MFDARAKNSFCFSLSSFVEPTRNTKEKMSDPAKQILSLKVGQFSLVSGQAVLDLEQHQQRLSSLRERQRLFEESSQQLATFMAASTTETSLMKTVASVGELSKAHKTYLKKPERYTAATQSNLPSLSRLFIARYGDHSAAAAGASAAADRKHSPNTAAAAGAAPATTSALNTVYVHILLAKNLPAEYRGRGLTESLKILKFFCHGDGSSQRHACFLKVFEVFNLREEQQVLVVEEWFALESTLQHRIWGQTWVNGSSSLAPYIKTWVIQLAEAVEKLNLAGVVHRFIRPETVLLSSRRDRMVRLTAFDYAALYWDREMRAPVPLRGGASGSPLPVKLPEHLLCHLPPECFHADGSPYDGTHVDVWSVGVLTCQLLTGTAPFEQMSAEGAGSAQAQQLALWKSCEERRMMAEEFRTLLDDIFVEAEYRITIGEVAKDFRLTCTDRRELLRRKPTTYYRIDVAKNINVSSPPPYLPPKSVPKQIAASTFSTASMTIFNLEGFKRMGQQKTERDLLPEYRIFREGSFDQKSQEQLGEQFLKAQRVGGGGGSGGVVVGSGTAGAGTGTGSGSTVSRGVFPCLARVLQKRRIPSAQRNLMTNESIKILRYFSSSEAGVISGRVHRLLEAFICQETTEAEKLILFFESLPRHRSLLQIVKEVAAASKESRKFPPSLKGSSMFTLSNVHLWVRDLTQTATHLAAHGLAHRYIRPEYLYVNEENWALSKLTHFDMACFAWNPVKSLWMPRTLGLQDKVEGAAWDHLPPDCFGHLYDALQVDVWSIGVLVVYCLCGVKPFSTPMTLPQAIEQWAAFREAHPAVFLSSSNQTPSHSAALFTDVLNRIFVHPDARISPKDLLTELENLPLHQSEYQQPQQQLQQQPQQPEPPQPTGQPETTLLLVPETPPPAPDQPPLPPPPPPPLVIAKSNDEHHSFLQHEKVKSNNEEAGQ